ncbi:MAG: ABC transporter permease [Candidatus Hodarchaeales archaeon]|jgi:peptide/nickel transport system permease protein
MNEIKESPSPPGTDFQNFIKFVVKRFLRSLIVIFGIITIVFFLFRVLPGDPARDLVGKFPTEARLAAVREIWGLDKPVWEQYLIFMRKLIFELDIGMSYDTSTPVLHEIGLRFPATVELTLVSMFLAILVGIPIGIISAYKQHTRIDYLSMILALVGVSMPIYWLGLMLQGVFARDLGWLIGTGRIEPVLSSSLNLYPFHTNFYLIDSFVMGVVEGNWIYFISSIQNLILPGIALATIPMAVIARMMRSSMIEEMQKDYVRTARSKGLQERLVVLKHVTKNALIPTITVIGLNFGALLAGAVLTETIFSWPGVGKYIWLSITQRDIPVIMGFVMIVAIIFVFANMFTDILYAYLDPRVRYYERD